MAAKAQKKAGKEVIDVATQQSILKYLVTMGNPEILIPNIKTPAAGNA